MSAIDWTATWGVVGPAIFGLGTWLATRKPSKAKVDAAVAQSKADAAVADAEGEIYVRLRKELDAMHRDIGKPRTELGQTRSELDATRAHSRRQDNYIWQLILLLRERGITPPPFDP